MSQKKMRVAKTSREKNEIMEGIFRFFLKFATKNKLLFLKPINKYKNMADSSITLRIYIPDDDETMKPVDDKGNELDSLTISSGSNEEGYIKGKVTHDSVTVSKTFKVSIKNIGFHKKMYSPNVITTELHISQMTGEPATEFLPSKVQVEELLLNRRVEMYVNKDTNLSVCNDYYVQKIEPLYLKTELFLTLTIYSPDYQMTIEKNCKTFVAQKLSKITSTQKANYFLPYDNNTNVAIDLEAEASKLQHIVKNGKEHIFPYLVQYNESYYDFLKRTANRWGEFLYYEHGQLHIGYDNNAQPTEVNDFYSRTYCAIDASMTKSEGSKLHPQATADKNMLDNPMTKDKYDVAKGFINSLGDKELLQDKYIMSKISSFFGNNKPLGTWAINTVIDDLVAWGIGEKKAEEKNDKFNDKYFKNIDSEAVNQYNDDKSKFNQFSEINPLLNATDYANLLKMELTAGRDAMIIDFQTTYPNLELGQKIQVAGEDYLVVELRGYQPSESTTYYEATCISSAKTSYTKDKEETITYSGFFPPLLETGHVRKSSLQHAVVTDVDDPLRANRVRVKFEWQGNDEKDSPWLMFAQSAATEGAGVHGRHYKKEDVLVDFINGNIERPYVIGAVNQKTPTPLRTSSIAMMSPVGHGMRITDGTGAGYTAFLASLTPGAKMLQGMFPGKDPVSQLFKLSDKEKNVGKRFEGSTEICDYYGIYSIKGSTDTRNITIKSPWGDVKINAFTGITVSAPNGDIKLQGKNVTIEAGNNLKLISGTNVKNKFISRVSSNGRESAVSALTDIPLIVAKKIQDLFLNPIDLSLIRNILEVGFKPQEGLLEIQSNRFLKLEAGGAKAGYPLNAYDSQEKLEQQFKEKVNNTMEMGPSIVRLINLINPCVDDLIGNYVKLYKNCLNKKLEFNNAYQKLEYYRNSRGNEKFCNKYTDLKSKLWDKNTKEITEADMGFVEAEVGFANNVELSPQCLLAGVANVSFGRNTNENGRKHVLKRRKEYRALVLKKANELLQSIQDFRKVRLLNYQRTWDVGFYFGTWTKYVPKDYLNAFKKAFEMERLKGIFFYDSLFKEENEALKNLNHSVLEEINRQKHKLALKRKVALNLLTDWGIKDQKTSPIVNNIPLGPAFMGKAPEKEEDLLGDQYTAYVRDLTIKEGSIIEKDSALWGNLGKSILDKVDPSRPVREYKSWGDTKDGAILFSDNKTYKLGAQIKTVDTKFSGGKFNLADLGDDPTRRMAGFMIPIREALRNLGVVNGGGAENIQLDHEVKEENGFLIIE